MIFYILAGLAVFGLDQYSKFWIRENFSIHVTENIHVIGNYFQITRVENFGIAFGFHFPGIEYLSYLAFIIISIFLFRIVQKENPDIISRYAFILIIAGALGNLVDRFIHGSVTDMILVGIQGHYWPVFNIADASVTIGISIFIITSYIANKTKDNVD